MHGENVTNPANSIVEFCANVFTKMVNQGVELPYIFTPCPPFLRVSIAFYRTNNQPVGYCLMGSGMV